MTTHPDKAAADAALRLNGGAAGEPEKILPLAIAESLKALYRFAEEEPVPDRLTALLERLRAGESQSQDN